MSEVGEVTTERILEEVKIEITNFEEEYEGEWWRVKEKTEKMWRTSEEEEKEHGQYVVTTARVELVISDRAVREIGGQAFYNCGNLWKITAPFVEEVGRHAFESCENLVEVVLPNVNMANNFAFNSCHSVHKVALPNTRSIGMYAFALCRNLRHITIHPDVEIDEECTFIRCYSLEVLAASANFEIDTGDKNSIIGTNDPTVGITRYLKWRTESDTTRKECFYTYAIMFKLCEVDKDDPLAPPPRAFPNDKIMKFLVEYGEGGIARTLLPFLPGGTEGKGDLRSATKAELLAVALELNVKINEYNHDDYWGVESG
jgi:hypothetical protein